MSNNSVSYVRTEEAPILSPPATEQGISGWLWQNIFKSMSNFSSIGAGFVSIFMIVLTAFFAYALVSLIWLFVDFVFISATWKDPEGLQREVCNIEGRGFCWPYIGKWFDAHVYGHAFPVEERWRVNLIYVILALGVVWLIWEKSPGRKYVAIFMLTLFPVLAFVFLNGSPVLDGQSFGDFFAQSRIFVDENGAGGINARIFYLFIGAVAAVFSWLGRRGTVGDFGEAFAPVFAVLAGFFFAFAIIPIFAGGLDTGLGLKVVPTAKWGGLLVTLVVALTGIIFSLPIGILLALGRRSNMPLVKWLCVVFIEVVRGIPLIMVLFFASTMLGYFLDEGVNFNKLLRALIGVALFASAYMAEVVRGGLQAVPKGQYEGAMSMGLSYSQMMRLIVLPQALTIVIPGIVNTFIGLFKDTTLVLIISIYDLLGIGQLVALKDLDFAGAKLPYTEYLFIAVIFWIFCFGMSRYSMYMERRLARGHH